VSRKALAQLAAVAAVALAGLGCHADRARPAPFRVRPDSVEQGSLIGPFDGRVVDAGTGDAIAGALVYATWSLERGVGAPEPVGFREAVASTDSSGRYALPKIGGLSGRARVVDFTLVIYKRGYVAYRSDRRFDDLGPRLDFAQRQNRVELERWRADLSHVRHLRYVGGGPALAALTAWEAPLAAAELGATHAGPRIATDLVVAGDRVVAAQLLGEAELEAITKFDGSFETGPLNDDPDTASYSSQHFKALGQPETFDVAIRLWRLPSAQAEARYRELLDTLPGATSRDELADRSLRAGEQAIFGVGFLDQARGVVVLLTCGEAQCKTPETAVALARAAYGKIKALVPANAAEDLTAPFDSSDADASEESSPAPSPKKPAPEAP
jgi:hypothetical protein